MAYGPDYQAAVQLAVDQFEAGGYVLSVDKSIRNLFPDLPRSEQLRALNAGAIEYRLEHPDAPVFRVPNIAEAEAAVERQGGGPAIATYSVDYTFKPPGRSFLVERTQQVSVRADLTEDEVAAAIASEISDTNTTESDGGIEVQSWSLIGVS